MSYIRSPFKPNLTITLALLGELFAVIVQGPLLGTLGLGSSVCGWYLDFDFQP